MRIAAVRRQRSVSASLTRTGLRTRSFPLTPLEAWYVMKGYAVRPARGISMDEFLELPGMIELSDGYVMLRQT